MGVSNRNSKRRKSKEPNSRVVIRELSFGKSKFGKARMLVGSTLQGPIVLLARLTAAMLSLACLAARRAVTRYREPPPTAQCPRCSKFLAYDKFNFYRGNRTIHCTLCCKVRSAEEKDRRDADREERRRVFMEGGDGSDEPAEKSLRR
jgi:hypothetical protein